MVTDDWAAAAEAFPSCVEEKATKPVSPTNTVSWCSAMNLAIGCVNSPAKKYWSKDQRCHSSSCNITDFVLEQESLLPLLVDLTRVNLITWLWFGRADRRETTPGWTVDNLTVMRERIRREGLRVACILSLQHICYVTKSTFIRNLLDLFGSFINI